MSTLEEVLADIDWDNDFDADNSDLEEVLNADMREEDLNLSISTNELFENCAELLDLADPTEEYCSSGDDIPLIEIVPPKMKKNGDEMEKLKSTALLRRFLDYFPIKLIEDIALHTGQKAVQSGCEFHVNSSLILRFFAATIRMNVYRLPSLKHYFTNAIGEINASKIIDKLTYSRIRCNLKCVWDDNVSLEERRKDSLWKVRPVMDCVRAAMQKLPRNPENLCIDEQIVPFLLEGQ